MSKYITYKSAIICLALLIAMSPINAQGAMEDTSRLTLDQETSIVLPYFDTSAIVGSDVQEIVLSLYLLERTPQSSAQQVQITINPFNLSTKQAEDGLSTFIELNTGQYVDFRLPIELFEDILGTNKRFLVKIVDSDQKLVFAGPDSTGTTADPKLAVVHSDKVEDPIQIPVINNTYINIANSQVHFGSGDNTGQNKLPTVVLNNAERVQESSILNNPWIIGIGVGLILLVLSTVVGIENNKPSNLQQYHSGSGDNIGGDKNE